LHAFPCTVTGGEPASVDGRTVAWVTREELAEYAFPRANRRLIERLAPGKDG
jgi:A/G-specific adenine glycosylase